MTRAVELARTVGLISVFLAAVPVAASAQDLRPCTPVAPGARCVQTTAGPWANLDFGQREQIAGLSNGWHPENVPFRVLFPHAGIDPSRAWWSHIVPPGAFDCAMAKPGDPALDPKMVIKPHPTHSGSSPAGVVTVPSCKSK